MKLDLYPRLALDGILKNKRMYLPYLLTCAGMVMMEYIICFLQYSDVLSSMPGEATTRVILNLGAVVIAFFACLFLFYTNSFLMRRRQKEFGLYNILGMGKGNISQILLWESVIIALTAITGGLVAGIAFSKLAELGLINVMHSQVGYTLSVSPLAVITTLAVFGVIFTLLFLNSLRKLHFSSSIELLRSENTGERPPKGNWVMGLLGGALLACAYYIALTIQDPVAALAAFFVAVILVIAGTYLLMIAGSVLLCRILQRCKRYYYRANHFVGVSSMVYRMKRNGAGLASICILATMVLVMISSSASLYFGSEDAIATRYPRQINMNFYLEDNGGSSKQACNAMRERIRSFLTEYGVTADALVDYRYISTTGVLTETGLEIDPTGTNGFDFTAFSNLCQIFYLPLEDYNAMTGAQQTLSEDEVLLCAQHTQYSGDSITFDSGATFRIKDRFEQFSGNGVGISLPNLFVVASDLETFLPKVITDIAPGGSTVIRWNYSFDTQLTSEGQRELSRALYTLCREFSEDQLCRTPRCESREENRADFFSLFGGLFFLGILLSAVFLFATVLIIYYKQLSEGYEDQNRFEIMQKVGMTKSEIRKSINSQLLTVFFTPLVLSIVHLFFAFPMIRKLLLMFNLNNAALFAATTGICIVVFALFYTLVYRITSNAYYHIVSGVRDQGE